MKKLAIAVALLTVVAMGRESSAGSVEAMRVSAHLGAGMAHRIGSFDDNWSGGSKPRFAMGFMADFDLYLSDKLALATGLWFIGKGSRLEGESASIVYDNKQKILYLEIPLGVKLRFDALIVGAGVNLAFAVRGKTKGKWKGDEIDEKWDDEVWKYQHRVNLSPTLVGGYAIDLGPVKLVPGLMFSMHLINDLKDQPNDETSRCMTLLGTLGVEYTL